MTAYYNELDPFAAQWLRNLISAGHIAPGDVDERSILDVKATELVGYTQCHFFAGIGGWSYALRFAGWPDDEPVWTGSCPCQPFSAAGRGGGFADERHLWPVWFNLIAERRPGVVFGEQVASKAGLGWLDAVYSDLEGAGYACGANDLCAAGVGAFHIRQRLYFVAHALHTGRPERRPRARIGQTPRRGGAGELAHAEKHGQQGRHLRRDGEQTVRTAESGAWDSTLADAEHQHGRPDQPKRGPEGRTADRWISPWSSVEWLPCRDGKSRPTQPGLFPLAHGIPGRVGRLRAYGNAIVPQVAAEFIRAYCEVTP